MTLQIASATAIVSVGIAMLVFVSLPKLCSKVAVSAVTVGFIDVIIGLGLFALLCAPSLRLFRRVSSIERKLSKYNEYRRDVIHRWGKEAVLNVEADL
jgi:hypothetical protein